MTGGAGVIQRALARRFDVPLASARAEQGIFRPLRMRDTSAPTNFPFLVGRHANGYSLQYDADGQPIEGTLFDITVFNPSLAWAAGNVVSDVDDLARFFRALLGGRLLPPAQLAEMKTPVAVAPGFGYGLGLAVSDTPCGPLYGHDGGIPGFGNIVLSSADGAHQFALMINAETAPVATAEPFALLTERAFREAFASDPCAAAPPQGSAVYGAVRRLPAKPPARRPPERVPRLR
jgi:D-alanyl-D-alanine carboxypeptidase